MRLPAAGYVRARHLPAGIGGDAAGSGAWRSEDAAAKYAIRQDSELVRAEIGRIAQRSEGHQGRKAAGCAGQFFIDHDAVFGSAGAPEQVSASKSGSGAIAPPAKPFLGISTPKASGVPSDIAVSKDGSSPNLATAKPANKQDILTAPEKFMPSDDKLKAKGVAVVPTKNETAPATTAPGATQGPLAARPRCRPGRSRSSRPATAWMDRSRIFPFSRW